MMEFVQQTRWVIGLLQISIAVVGSRLRVVCFFFNASRYLEIIAGFWLCCQDWKPTCRLFSYTRYQSSDLHLLVIHLKRSTGSLLTKCTSTGTVPSAAEIFCGWDSQSCTWHCHQATLELCKTPRLTSTGEIQTGLNPSWPATVPENEVLWALGETTNPLSASTQQSCSVWVLSCRCRAGFSLSDLSSSFKNYTA